ncbi:MAG: DUF1592 domain-containing protein [Verrucomicrobiales bacterium]
MFPLLLVLAQAGAAEELRAFLADHCVKCHGPEKAKADLRLDELALPPAELEQWAAILEAVEYEDMPPAKEERPDEARMAAFKTALTRALVAEGEAPALRRMNRAEFEHTVNDLLGIEADLAEILPADGEVQGFDKVGQGLSLSAVQLEKYLEAANLAFDTAIRRITPSPVETRRALTMEQKDNKESVVKKKGGAIESHGAIVDFSPGWPPTRLDGANAREPGRYQVRVALWPHEPGDHTLAVEVFTGPLFGTGKRVSQGVYDVTGSPKEPRIIEFETWMNEGDSIQVLPQISPVYIPWLDKERAKPGVAILWGEITGPLDQEFPSLSQRRLFGESATMSMAESGKIWMRHRKNAIGHVVESSASEADVERIFRDFVPRALRRPVSEEVIGEYVAYAKGRLAEGRSFEEAVRAGFCAVLCSPRFLLLNAGEEVDDFAIAERMSYFFWSSLPDEELRALAAAGKLWEPEIRRTQADRMLADAKRERFLRGFTGQWLDLREIQFTTPDDRLYPEFDVLLEKAMVEETEGFFRHLLVEDLPVGNFVKADFTLLNERLARHYELPPLRGHEEMQVVKLPEGSIRGGVLSQASVLKVTANGTNTSPVLRGVWVLDRIFGQPVPPPPPGIPAVEPDIRGASSPREMFAKHTEAESCARCHDRIDPVGFALEEFDVIGNQRTFYRALSEGEKVKVEDKWSVRKGLEVDAAGTTPDGESFAGFAGLREWLAGHPEIFTRALTRKLMIYGGGRPVEATDRAAIEAVIEATGSENPGLRTLLREVVASEFFVKP